MKNSENPLGVEHLSYEHHDVGDRANYEGNHTELLLERVKNRNIKNQIIELLYENGQAYIEFLKTRKFKSFGKPEQNLIQDQDGVIYTKDELDYVAPSPERVEAMLDIWIFEAGRVTNITFDSKEQPNEETMSPFWCMPSGERLTTKQLSIAEAHEKGHAIRQYGTDFFRSHFAKGFDISRVEFTKDDYEETKKVYIDEDGKVPSFDEARDDFYRYLFSGPEIAERMSQLKNYFGLSGDEEFTKEHLNYAREHYVKDTGLDNRMTPFLKAITEKTEPAFLELINSSGI